MTDPGGPSGSGCATVGLAVGEGTGPELATVFRQAVEALGEPAGVRLDIVECPHRFRTYAAPRHRVRSPQEVAAIAAEDARVYEAFLRGLAEQGARAVFRTAFNAQALYLVRERLEAVKVERLPLGDGSELLLVRDQAQGFYTGTNDEGDPDAIRRVCTFRRGLTERLLDFALAEAALAWKDGPPDHFLAAYKFHLLDNRLAQWVDAWSARRGVTVRLFQPDTMNRNLLRGTFRGRILVLGSNEWADIVHTDLLSRSGLGSQEERATKNVYLAPGVSGLVELQTVHGSADDLAGRGVVNPAATLRAAARILEEAAGAAGASRLVERALEQARAAGITTPDAGGASGTSDVARAVLERCRFPGPERLRPSAALVLVDLQNDFAAPDGWFARRGLVDPVATRRVAQAAGGLAATARRCGVPVVFTRMVADDGRLPSVVRERNAREGREGFLRPSSHGARLFGVEPTAQDVVLEKAGYDAFLGTPLEAVLKGRGIQEVVIAGLFSDVCVDALARTAYQKGFRVAVVADATAPLERRQEECLSFMARFYGARVVTAASLIEAWEASVAPAPLAASGSESLSPPSFGGGASASAAPGRRA